MSLPGEYIDPNPPATLAEALARPDVAPRFCLTVTCGIRYESWFQVSGYAYLHPLGDFSGVFNDSVDEITAVKVNGVALTAAANRDEVVSTQGRFFWDGIENQCLLISLADGSNPQARGVTVEAFATYRFSDGPCDAGGYRWRPKIASLPDLERRISPSFNGITQIGGGTVVFENEDHFFDERRGQNWDAGRVTLQMGASGLPFSEYRTLATFVASAPKMTEGQFTLNLQDPKILVDGLFPSALYEPEDFPALDPAAFGTPIQVAYGLILGVAPTCIDTATGTFQVAGHAIKSFQGVRVQDQATGLWLVSSFASTDLALAQFTLAPGTWALGQMVVVDFEGKKNTDDSLMDNPADIVADILGQIGQPVDAGSFATAHNWYDAGEIQGPVIRRKTLRAPSLYLNTQGMALATIEQIMVNARAYLQAMPDGSLTMTPFRNYRGSVVPVITDNAGLAPGLVLDGNGTTSNYVQAGKKVTSCQVVFGTKPVEGYRQVYTYTSPENKYTRNMPTDVVAVVESLFTNRADAEYLAQAIVNQDRVDQSFWTAALKWQAWQWLPGQGVRVFSARHCIDQIMEVLTIKMQLTSRKVTVTLGNARGFEQASGFWSDGAETTPLGNDLGWPQVGEANDLTGETEYVRHEAGHWVGVDDYAVDTANPSNLAWSDLDKAPSRWQ